MNYPIRLNDKIGGLYNYANSGNNTPTRQVKQAYADLAAMADIQLKKLQQLMDKEVVELNQLIREKAVPVIATKKE